MDEKDLEQVRETIKYLKYERKRLMEQIKTIDETLKWMSKMLGMIITLEE